MKLQNYKETKNIINLLDLKPRPYDLKLGAMNAVALLIPICSFPVVNVLLNDVYRAISFTALSTLCFSSPLMIYAYVRDFEKKYKPDLKDKYLTNEEITILNNNAHLFKSDLNEIMDKAVTLKDLKIKRDARDISSYKYKDRVRNL